jgi:conjugative relaxase-like TrwC/TraI family protein
MLSIGKVQRGASGKRYYMNLSEEDYYLKQDGGELPGFWMGKGSVGLGLTGPVDREDFCKLFDGYSPSGEALTRNTSHANRRPAFDLTYSAPKSFSIIRAEADPELAAQLDQAMLCAVQAGLDYLEQNATFSRRGAQGSEVVEGRGLTVAAFQHLISRGLDPQDHIHCVVFNFTKGPDGEYRTLDGYELYLNKMASGAAFRAELAHRCELLGFEVERDSFSFRIKGVPEQLEGDFSKRSKQIREALGDPDASAARKAKATLETREPKSDVDREEITAGWHEVAARHGVTSDFVRRLTQGPRPEHDIDQELRETMDRAIGQFSRSGESTFTERKLAEYAFVEAQCRGLSANDVSLSVWATLEHARRETPGSLVYLGNDPRGDERFTTRRHYELEQDIIRMAEESRGDRRHLVSDRAFKEAIAKRPTIRPEQAEAVRAITQEEGSLKNVCGWAGTGKTFALDCAREAWEGSGYTVIGGAVSGKAARGLAEEAHMKCDSVAKILWDLENPTPKAKFKPLDERTVVVIDEAGMLGSEQLHRLQSQVHAANAKLVLVGDERQIQAIDAGGGFAGLSKRLGYAELKEITRQRNEDDRQAVYDFAEGRAALALDSYAKRGRLVLGDDKQAALRAIASDWQEDPTAAEEKLILASTNAQAADLNALVQQARLDEGQLGALSFRKGDEQIHVNDRILFTGRAKWYGIVNGDLATVTDYDPAAGTMSVKLDTGDRMTLPVDKAPEFRLGYTLTTHKGQGATVENAYVFVYGGMTDLQMSYVQTSRARGVTKIYSTKDEAGEGLEDLVRAMSQDRMKHLAHDMAVRQETHQQGHDLRIGM